MNLKCLPLMILQKMQEAILEDIGLQVIDKIDWDGDVNLDGSLDPDINVREI